MRVGVVFRKIRMRCVLRESERQRVTGGGGRDRGKEVDKISCLKFEIRNENGVKFCGWNGGWVPERDT